MRGTPPLAPLAAVGRCIDADWRPDTWDSATGPPSHLGRSRISSANACGPRPNAFLGPSTHSSNRQTTTSERSGRCQTKNVGKDEPCPAAIAALSRRRSATFPHRELVGRGCRPDRAASPSGSARRARRPARRRSRPSGTRPCPRPCNRNRGAVRLCARSRSCPRPARRQGAGGACSIAECGSWPTQEPRSQRPSKPFALKTTMGWAQRVGVESLRAPPSRHDTVPSLDASTVNVRSTPSHDIRSSASRSIREFLDVGFARE